MRGAMIDALQPGTTLGRYPVEELIGDDGPIRLVVRQEDVDRSVTLPVARDRAGSSETEALRERARRLAAVDHPNVRSHHECGVAGEVLSFPTADVRGAPIATAVERGNVRRERA